MLGVDHVDSLGRYSLGLPRRRTEHTCKLRTLAKPHLSSACGHLAFSMAGLGTAATLPLGIILSQDCSALLAGMDRTRINDQAPESSLLLLISGPA
ncbi:hypothetical protein M011DRAFT_292698 [Sporormia fimetaria CBS 119925]|uniref:Uncharacterized protein n=1 Tax=Sporormia fimetaria CBS 119925 TaxID=1340428 RepID=A0A6A6UYL9_9PLEO|nr:hypothetical protein M011DRAFT_292698 [Sporormia fimetaria CBS 119925]